MYIYLEKLEIAYKTGIHTAMVTRGSFLFLFAFAAMVSCTPNVDPSLITAHQGQMDLSSWNQQQKGSLSLDGEWEFFYGKLLTPDDFNKQPVVKPDGFALVPYYWNNQLIGGKKFNAIGFATYRLRLKNIPGHGLLSIRLWHANTAYRLWVNEEMIAANGTVSALPAAAKPAFLPLVRTFSIPSDSIQIVVQVSNYSHINAGLANPVELGTPEAILKDRDTERSRELWMAGAMFILFIYHLFIFALRNKEYAALWFALLCLDSTIRNVVTNEAVLYTEFPGFPFLAGLRIDYLTVTMGVPAYVMLAYEFFKSDWSKLVRNAILIICGLEFILICFFPTVVFTALLTWIQAIVLLECCYLIYIVTRAMINKRPYAILSFVSYWVCFAGIIHDVLVAHLILSGPFVIFYAFSIFLLMQAYILASRNAGAYKRIEYLSEELNEANTTLEKKVEDRTAELRQSTRLLTSEKRKSDELLLNILPEEIAEELKLKGSSVARRYPSVTVMFTDFKDFTRISEELTPEQLVQEIDHCYRAFDGIVEKHGLEKIKTMGDAYICAGGLPVMNFTHPEDMVKAALEIRDFMKAYGAERRSMQAPFFEIRIGIHTGPVVAGIVGSKKFAYDIWGDAVNLAARMESSGEVGKVNISGATFHMIKDKFNCAHRGQIEAKNKGGVDMYFAEHSILS